MQEGLRARAIAARTGVTPRASAGLRVRGSVGARPISPKMAANIYGALVTMCREAHTDGLLKTQPWLLPRGFLKRKSTKKRTPYSVSSVLALLRSPSVHPTARVFAASPLSPECAKGKCVVAAGMISTAAPCRSGA